jgi:hypothetical protein
MPEREFKIIKWFDNKVPAMAVCSSCRYKFVTPSTLKRDPTAAELYLRERFSRHECTDELPRYGTSHMGCR